MQRGGQYPSQGQTGFDGGYTAGRGFESRLVHSQ